MAAALVPMRMQYNTCSTGSVDGDARGREGAWNKSSNQPAGAVFVVGNKSGLISHLSESDRCEINPDF